MKGIDTAEPLRRAPALVELDSISKHYPSQTQSALVDVSIRIEAGEYISIGGPSGAGKSTLLGILGGIEVPSSGTYRFDGVRVDELESRALARFRGETIGFVFQNFQLLPRLSVLQNVALPLVYSGIPRIERHDLARGVLRQLGLLGIVDRWPSQLSGGQQQRVGVARALCGTPKMLLADEPTGSLDQRSSDEILDLLGALNENGLTIVLVTHDDRVSDRTDRRICLRHGKIESGLD